MKRPIIVGQGSSLLAVGMEWKLFDLGVGVSLFNFYWVLPANETVKILFWHFSVTYNVSFTKKFA